MNKITSTERARLWRLKNPDKAKAIQQRYVKNNPEVRKASFTKYWKGKREENPELWKEEMKEKAKQHRLKHLDKYKKMEKEKSAIRRMKGLDTEYNKKYQRSARLAKYGLNEESYQKMVSEQSGKCALCNQEQKNFHIDHCHKSLKVRGLLCGGCNMMLGLIEKRLITKKDFLESIALYLKH